MSSRATGEENHDEQQPPTKKQRGVYYCPVCDQYFTERRTLLRHCRESKSHLDKIQWESTERLACNQCPQTFARAHDLKRHCDEVHEGVLRSFNCKQAEAQEQEGGRTTVHSRTGDLEMPDYSHDSNHLEMDTGPTTQASESQDKQYRPHVLASEYGVSFSDVSASLPRESSSQRVGNEEHLEQESNSGERIALPQSADSASNESGDVDTFISSAFEDLCMNDSLEAKAVAGANRVSQPITVKKCTVCFKYHKDPASLIGCMVVHLENPLRPWECPHCQFSFVKEDHLNHHLRQASKDRHCGFHFPHEWTGHHPLEDEDSGRLATRRQMEIWYLSQQCLKAQKTASKLTRTVSGATHWSLNILDRRASKLSQTSSLNTRWTSPSLVGSLRRPGPLKETESTRQIKPVQLLQSGKLTDLMTALRNRGRGPDRLQRDIKLYNYVLNGKIEDLKSLNLTDEDLTERVQRYPPLIPEDFYPLTLAWKQGNVDMVNILLDLGTRGNLHSLRGVLPCEPSIAGAVQIDSLVAVRTLMASGLSVDMPDTAGITGVYVAVRSANHDLLRFLVSMGSDLDQQHGPRGSPLMLATHLGDSETVELLLTLGADPGTRYGGLADDFNCLSPLLALLHAAAKAADDDSTSPTTFIKLAQALNHLLDYRATFDSAALSMIWFERLERVHRHVGSGSNRCLARFDLVWGYAMLHRHLETVVTARNFDSILNWGGGFIASQREGPDVAWGAIFPLAVEYGDIALARFVIWTGVSVDYVKIDGRPLEIAFEKGDDNIVRMLLTNASLGFQRLRLATAVHVAKGDDTSDLDYLLQQPCTGAELYEALREAVWLVIFCIIRDDYMNIKNPHLQLQMITQGVAHSGTAEFQFPIIQRLLEHGADLDIEMRYKIITELQDSEVRRHLLRVLRPWRTAPDNPCVATMSQGGIVSIRPSTDERLAMPVVELSGISMMAELDGSSAILESEYG